MTGRAVSAIDGRYAGQTAPLADYFSEWALMKYRVTVEVEWLIAICGSDWADNVRRLNETEIVLLRNLVESFDDASYDAIKEVEKTTNHDVKAVEYFLREKLKKTSLSDVMEYIHFGCTSEDINNLAYAMMLRDGVSKVWNEKADTFISLVAEAAARYRDIAMLSRTHGQAATPTTVGKELAVFVARWQRQVKIIKSIEYLGKFGGVVGNFNPQTVAYPDAPWEKIAREFVTGLGLAYNPLTTQIEPHDYIAECFHALIRFNNILLDFDRDMWTYISLAYFKQQVVQGETGSSTMPHKVNPINFENSEANAGMSTAILSHLADKLQVSRLQRDLSDSSALRNIGSGIAHSYLAINNAITGFQRVDVDREAIGRDLDASWEVLGEAIQTVMRKNGYDDPYETLKSFTRGKKLSEASIKGFIRELIIPDEDKARLEALTPSTYTGIAAKLVDHIR